MTPFMNLPRASAIKRDCFRCMMTVFLYSFFFSQIQLSDHRCRPSYKSVNCRECLKKSNGPPTSKFVWFLSKHQTTKPLEKAESNLNNDIPTVCQTVTYFTFKQHSSKDAMLFEHPVVNWSREEMNLKQIAKFFKMLKRENIYPRP